jgi:hypothetical protein
MNKKNHRFIGILIAVIVVSGLSLSLISNNFQDEYFSGFFLRFRLKEGDEGGSMLKKIFVSSKSVIDNNSTNSVRQATK